MKTIIVTGGSGLIGSAIREIIEAHNGAQSDEQWIFLSSADADLTDMNQTEEKIFKRYKPTHVIHLAAMVGGLFKNMRMGVEFFRQNMMINDTILHLSYKYGVEKVVSCLSTCIFPNNTEYPIDETMIHNGPPHESNEGYAYAKRMIDIQNKCYNKYGCKFTSVVPTNIFGKHDNFNLEDSHIIPAIIHKMYLAKATGGLKIAGSGAPLRQFIYSLDLARLFIWTLRNYDDIDPVILSGDEQSEISIKDVVELIAEAIEYTADIIYDTSLADGQYKKTASNKKLMGLLAQSGVDFKFTPMKVALKETVDWFINNYPNVRL